MPQTCINEYKRRENEVNYEDVSKPCDAEGVIFCPDCGSDSNEC